MSTLIPVQLFSLKYLILSQICSLKNELKLFLTKSFLYLGQSSIRLNYNFLTVFLIIITLHIVTKKYPKSQHIHKIFA